MPTLIPRTLRRRPKPHGERLALGSSVLILSTVGGVGGATRVVGTLASGMRRLGIAARLVFPDPAAIETIAAIQWLEGEGVGAESSAALPAWYAPHGLPALWRLRGLVAQAGPSVTYLHYGSNQIAFRDVLAVRAARRGRCAVMVHHAAPIRGRHRQLMTRIGAELAHVVVVSSPAMKGLLTGIGVRSKKIVVVPLGVPAPRSNPTRHEARSRLGLDDGAFVVATVARLDPGKNVPLVVRSVASLVREGVNAHLLVAGTGVEFAAVTSLIKEILERNGRMLGRVESLDDLYAAADVFALPSLEEGFGLVFLEAAWHGVPSLAYAVGGVPYAISDGATGVLVEAGDEAEFSNQLRRLCQDASLRTSLGAAARVRVEAEFTDRLMTERHLDRLLPGWNTTR